MYFPELKSNDTMDNLERLWNDEAKLLWMQDDALLWRDRKTWRGKWPELFNHPVPDRGDYTEISDLQDTFYYLYEDGIMVKVWYGGQAIAKVQPRHEPA